MLVYSSRNLGKRSVNPRNLTLANDLTLNPYPVLSSQGLNGLGVTMPDATSLGGYIGYAAIGLLGYYLLFGGSRAKERRAALKTAAQHYQEERQQVYQKYGRI